MPVDTRRRSPCRHAAFTSLLIFALAAAGAAQASDVTRFEVEFYAPGKSEPVNRATVWVGPGILRIDQQPGGDVGSGPSLIYRGDRGLVYSISPAKQSYVEVDRRTITRLQAQARRLRHEFATQLAALPPGQRAQLERMLGMSGIDAQQNTDPIVVMPEKGKGKDQVAGYTCRRVVLERGDRRVGKGCVADWAQIGISKTDLETFRTLANLQRDAMAARGFTPLELVPNQPLDFLTQLGGMPLSFERTDSKSGLVSSIRVRKVSPVRLAARIFEPPEGYARHTGGAAMLEQLAGSDESAGTSSPPAAAGASPAK